MKGLGTRGILSDVVALLLPRVAKTESAIGQHKVCFLRYKDKLYASPAGWKGKTVSPRPTFLGKDWWFYRGRFSWPTQPGK